jgi:hypothetical protein
LSSVRIGRIAAVTANPEGPTDDSGGAPAARQTPVAARIVRRPIFDFAAVSSRRMEDVFREADALAGFVHAG